MSSLTGAGRLFHNIGPSDVIDRFQNVDCTEDTCKLLQYGEEVGRCKYILQARKRQMRNVAYTYATEHNC